jgi:hypothetical protein
VYKSMPSVQHSMRRRKHTYFQQWRAIVAEWGRKRSVERLKRQNSELKETIEEL